MDQIACTTAKVSGAVGSQITSGRVDESLEGLIQDKMFTDQFKTFKTTLEGRNCRDISLAGASAAVFVDGRLQLWDLDRGEQLWAVKSFDQRELGVRKTMVDETGLCLHERTRDSALDTQTYELYSNGERFSLSPARLRCPPICSWGSVFGVQGAERTHEPVRSQLIEWDRTGCIAGILRLEPLDGYWTVDIACSQKYVVVVGSEHKDKVAPVTVVVFDRISGNSSSFQSKNVGGDKTTGDIIIAGDLLIMGHHVKEPYDKEGNYVSSSAGYEHQVNGDPRILVHNLLTGKLEEDYLLPERYATIRSIRCNNRHIVCHGHRGGQADWIYRMDRVTGKVDRLIHQDSSMARKVSLFLLGNCLNVVTERGHYMAHSEGSAWYQRTVVDVQKGIEVQTDRYPRSLWNTCTFTPKGKFVISERNRGTRLYGDDFAATPDKQLEERRKERRNF